VLGNDAGPGPDGHGRRSVGYPRMLAARARALSPPMAVAGGEGSADGGWAPVLGCSLWRGRRGANPLVDSDRQVAGCIRIFFFRAELALQFILNQRKYNASCGASGFFNKCDIPLTLLELKDHSSQEQGPTAGCTSSAQLGPAAATTQASAESW
jgi:hypothetical protein